MYIKEGHLGRSIKQSLYPFTSPFPKHIFAGSNLKRQQGAEGKVTNFWLGQLGFLGIIIQVEP